MGFNVTFRFFNMLKPKKYRFSNIESCGSVLIT